ncbi:response regulator transcription factor [Methylosinus sp. PW1]|uniref:response regulator transcription factor n=1 Tax=Methylosinus sp. PW1 TaxID=107636 RepID=UPI00055CFB20|nr:helix-turn-helix transcriptional regulator [Methylosinus sp. PW1]
MSKKGLCFPGTRPADRLTPAEEQVMCLAAGGMTRKEIAAALALRDKTIDNRFLTIFDKLAARSMSEAVEAWRSLREAA